MTISAITPKGQVLSFDPILRPVMALKSGATRGSALDRVMREDGEEKPAGSGLARLSTYDIEQVDRGILNEGLSPAKALHGEGRSPLLFLPAAFCTLSAPRARREVLEMAKDAQRRLNARMVLEITHLDPGLPPSRLVELVGQVRPVFSVVFARIKVERRAIAAVTGCALAGAAVEAAHINDPEDAELLTRVRLVMAAVGPRMLLHNVRTTAAINAAHSAGISYASLDLTHMGGEAATWPSNESGGEVSPAAA